jgi:hypothetical protein
MPSSAPPADSSRPAVDLAAATDAAHRAVDGGAPVSPDAHVDAGRLDMDGGDDPSIETGAAEQALIRMRAVSVRRVIALHCPIQC